MPPPAPTLLFEDEHVQLLFRLGSTPYTLGTFSNFGFKADGVGFWGRQLCEALDVECFGFVAKKSNWFPRASMSAATATANKVSTKPLITYGHSQGGYAAIKYAAALGATGVIAGSPQFSINPSIVADRRFTPYFNTFLNEDMEIATSDFSGRVVLIYDPLDVGDNEHGTKILDQGRQSTTVLPIYYLGHDIMEVLQKREFILELIDFCLGNSSEAALFLKARDLKKNSVRYGIRFAEQLLRHNKQGTALKVMDTILKRGGGYIHLRDRTAKAFTSALAYRAIGRTDEAIRQISLAQEAEPENRLVQAKARDMLFTLVANQQADVFIPASLPDQTQTFSAL